jgi:predicted phosphodiesterase
MKIRYVSDVHLEHMSKKEALSWITNCTPGEEDVFVLAGDIGNPYTVEYKRFIEHLHAHWKKVYILAGNHEYYTNGHTVEETNTYLEEYFKEYSNIVFLNNSSEVYEGVRFIGSTMWSNIENSYYTINDTKCIKGMTVQAYQDLHTKAVEYVEKTLLESKEPVVMITHHMPSYELIDEQYKKGRMQMYNQWFASHLDSMIETYKEKMKCWIYGHTHTRSQKELCGVVCVCNPLGYPGENALNYGHHMEIEI